MDPSEKMIEIMQQLTDNICRQKDALIVERIKQKTGIDIDISAEGERMFPRVRRVLKTSYQKMEEEFYWDNGTEEGLLLITFFEVETNCNSFFEKDRQSLNISLKYI